MTTSSQTHKLTNSQTHKLTNSQTHKLLYQTSLFLDKTIANYFTPLRRMKI